MYVYIQTRLFLYTYMYIYTRVCIYIHMSVYKTFNESFDKQFMNF